MYPLDAQRRRPIEMNRMSPHLLSREIGKRIQKDSTRPNELRDAAFRRVVLSIPKGKVATYGAVAAAAGYPLYHRAVARLLRNEPPNRLPWQRVVGAGGVIKLPGAAGAEQRLRLKLEGVAFQGKRVNLTLHRHEFRMWEDPV
jgi:methylated-DNA-protein-cysteine methyltransferase-like protein